MRTTAFVVGVVALLFALSGCGAQNNILRNVTPETDNITVYVAAWNENGDTGDQALLERKPNGKAWVLPLDATVLSQPDALHTVKVTVTPEGLFLVEGVGGTKVGVDHDDCLADGETYVQMRVPDPRALVFEEEVAPQRSNQQDTDCLPTPSS